MTDDLQNVRRLAATLRENLVKCADDPNVDAVHDTRTGTRRLQATLEDLVRETPDGEPLQSAATAAMRLLKKIRHEAGPVRDLDVHRKLVEKLIRQALDPAGAQTEKQDGEAAAVTLDALETHEAGLRMTGVGQQASDLDAWLKHRRNELADGLRGHANDLAEKLDKRLEELEAAFKTKGVRRARKKPPGVVALDSFARLATEMQVLDAGNLHDFRKGAKKARYVAELAAHGDEQAKQVGEALKKLQDEIGDWHDWLVLAEEAHTALGHDAKELTELIEEQRERHFVAAMKTASKLRGRLMGEWLAVSRRPVGRSVRPASAVRRRVAGQTGKAVS
jgi:CHAD domain-containing protein